MASPSSPASPEQTSTYRGEPSLERLVLHFVAAKKSLTATQHFYRATELATQAQQRRGEDALAAADAEIARFRALLRQIDELENEFEKIQRIRDIVRSFRARVEAMDRRIGR